MKTLLYFLYSFLLLALCIFCISFFIIRSNKQKAPIIEYPEEWRAIEKDTMLIIRRNDTLFIHFIH